MVESSKKEWEMTSKPPEDDVCPVCFSDYSLPCRTSCGHWFCGSCILQFWNHGSALQPCKCPLCWRQIKSLTPLSPPTSLNQCAEDGAEATLKTVEQYNRLFVGGVRGVVLKIRETPLLAKRILREMTEPNQAHIQFHIWRLFSAVLSLLYMFSPYIFLSPGVDIMHICNSFAMLMALSLKLAGCYTRRRAGQRVNIMHIFIYTFSDIMQIWNSFSVGYITRGRVGYISRGRVAQRVQQMAAQPLIMIS